MNDKTLLIAHAISMIKSIPHPTAGARLQLINAGIGALMSIVISKTDLVRVHSSGSGVGRKTLASASFVHASGADSYAFFGFEGAL
jgi:hypothetical protein